MKKKVFIDGKGRLFGKYDLFVPLFVIIILTLGFLVARVLLQKDTYITAELFASGGEWWWENTEPPYWLVDPIKEGAIEYDTQGKPLVEVLETKKFEVGDRKMLWMKVRLKVTPSEQSGQYRFRREPLQIGSLIYVSPNNVRIASNVLSIEGVVEPKEELEKTITLKAYDQFPWFVDSISAGDKMYDSKGNVLAEVLDKKVVDAEVMISDDRGNVYARRNPLKRDMTLTMKIKITRTDGVDYFSFFQPIKVGYYILFPMENANVEGLISEIK